MHVLPIALAAAASAVAPSAASILVWEAREPADRTLAEFLDLLESRDRAVDRLFLRYSFVPIPRIEAASSPPLERPDWSADGWWVFDRHRLAAFVVFHVEDDAPSWTWSVWNGARLRTARGQGEVLEAEGAPVQAARAIEVYDRARLHALSYDVAGPMGLFYKHEPWSQFLRHEATDVVLVGRRELQGRDCLGVLFDAVPDGVDDGVYEVPICAWFDDEESLLALFVQSYKSRPDAPAVQLASLASRDSGPESRPGVEDPCPLERLEEDWEEFQYNEILEYEAVFDGVFVGTRAKRATFEYVPELPDVEIQVVGSPGRHVDLERDRFELPVAYPLLVHDRVLGQTYSFGSAEGGGEFSAEDFRFWSMLQNYGGLLGAEMDVAYEHHPFERSVCGANALLYSMAVVGAGIDLDAILLRLPPEERTEGAGTLSTLRRIAAELGCRARVAQATVDELSRGAIVSLRGTGDEPTRHFAVAVRRDPESVLLLTPPGKVDCLSLRGFRDLWDGRALWIGSGASEKSASTSARRTDD